MASNSVLIVALLFSVLILCLQGTYAERITSVSASASAFAFAFAFASASASASASGAIGGGFGNGNWDSQGYGDDEERTAARRKKRLGWKISLKVKFMQAINYYGLENATPKRILEFMNEPDLNARHVATRLQKYRKYVKDKKDADDAGDEEKREKLSRSSFALIPPELSSPQLIGSGQSSLLNGSNFTPVSSSFENLGSHFINVNQVGVYLPSSCSAGFETGPSSAYQFPPNLPNINAGLDHQQNVPVLPPPEGNFNDQCGLPNIIIGGGNNTNTVVATPTLINNNNISHEQESARDPDIFMMPDDFFPYEQDNYQPPSQQQDGGHDQLPYQVEVPDPAANQVPNLSADQVPNPGPFHVQGNAPDETILEPEHIWDVHIRYADILDGGIWNAGTWEAGPWY